MKKIGILSDTHSYWDDKYLHYFEPCDEIWHAGDIGSVEVAEKLAAGGGRETGCLQTFQGCLWQLRRGRPSADVS